LWKALLPGKPKKGGGKRFTPIQSEKIGNPQKEKGKRRESLPFRWVNGEKKKREGFFSCRPSRKKFLRKE